MLFQIQFVTLPRIAFILANGPAYLFQLIVVFESKPAILKDMAITNYINLSVTNSSPFQNFSHLDDHTIRTTYTPGCKPLTMIKQLLPL